MKVFLGIWVGFLIFSAVLDQKLVHLFQTSLGLFFFISLLIVFISNTGVKKWSSRFIICGVFVNILCFFISFLTFKGFIGSEGFIRSIMITQLSLETLFFTLGLQSYESEKKEIYFHIGEKNKGFLLLKNTYYGRNNEHIKEVNIEEKLKNLARENSYIKNERLNESIKQSRLNHEMRTPLNSILGFSQILLSRGKYLSNDATESYYYQIKRSGEILLSLVEKNSNSYSSKTIVKNDIDEFNLFTLWSEIEKKYKEKITYKKIKFDIYMDKKETPERVLVDGNKVKVCINNILDNALKFTERGTISISLTTLIGENTPHFYDILITISDTGIGMRKEKLENILALIDQKNGQDETIKLKKDLGNGLSVVKANLNDLNGYLGVLSEEEKGTVVTIHLKGVLGLKTFESGSDHQYLYESVYDDSEIIISDSNDEIEKIFSLYRFRVKKISISNVFYLLDKDDFFPRLIVVDSENLKMEHHDLLLKFREKFINKGIYFLFIYEKIFLYEKLLKLENEYFTFLKKPFTEKELKEKMDFTLPHKKIKFKT